MATTCRRSRHPALGFGKCPMKFTLFKNKVSQWLPGPESARILDLNKEYSP